MVLENERCFFEVVLEDIRCVLKSFHLVLENERCFFKYL